MFQTAPDRHDQQLGTFTSAEMGSITSAVTVASVALGDGQLAQQLGEAEADREFHSPLDRNGKLTGLMRSRQPQ